MVRKGTIEGKGFTMDYFCFGKGERPFVLLPGVSPDPITPIAELVAKQYSRFHDDFTTYVFDRKRDFEDGYTIEQMVDDTAEAMRSLGIKDACVMGTSQGGMMALVLAAKYPELVSKLVPCCTTACAEDVTISTINDWAELAKAGEVEALFNSFYRNVFSEAFQQKNANAIKAAIKLGTPEGLERVRKLVNACLGFDARPLLGNIKCDCLVVGSRIDNVLGLQPALNIAKALNCPTVIYDEYGHAAFDEAYADLHEHLIQFFNA